MAFAKIIQDYVYFRKIDDLVIFDHFGIIKSKFNIKISLSSNLIFIINLACSLMTFLFMRLQKVLMENLVKTQIIYDPTMMPFKCLRRTGKLLGLNTSFFQIVF